MEGMDFLRDEQLIDIIKKEQINFIGSAVTPWHAHGIDCAVRYLQDRGVLVKGIVLVKPAVRQTEVCQLLTEQNFVNKCCRIYKSPAEYDTRLSTLLKAYYVGYESTNWYNKQHKQKHDKTIYIASPWHLDYKIFSVLYQSVGVSYGFQLMLVEEGLSSYFPQIDTKKHIWNSLSTNKSGLSLVMSFLSSVAFRAIRRRFEARTSWINLNLLIGKSDDLKPNRFSVGYYRQVLMEYAEKNRNKFPILRLENAVIICTMAYLHTEIKEESDVKTLKLVVDELKRRELKVYLKPHPRDKDYRNRYASLACDFIDYPCTVEVFLAMYPQVAGIVSFSSTALVTAKLLFGLKSVSILNLVEKEKYGKYIREEMESFTFCFSNVVEMPNSIKELGNRFVLNN